MREAQEIRATYSSRQKLSDAPSPDKRRVMNAERTRKVGLPTRSFIDFTFHELDDILTVGGCKPSEAVAKRWLCPQFAPPQAVIDLRDAFAALEPLAIADMAGIKAWFKAHDG